MEIVGELEDIVGKKIDDGAVEKELALWCFSVKMQKLKQKLSKRKFGRLFNRGAKKLGVDREKVGEYFIVFRAAGRFKGWPSDESECPGVHGRFAAVLIWRLFRVDPYLELDAKVRKKAFELIDSSTAEF